MPQFLSTQDARYIEQMLDETLEEIDTRSPYYQPLYIAYNSFEPESNTSATIAQVVAAIRPVNAYRADILAQLIFDRIRASNYPSAWNPHATQARDNYVATHRGNNLSEWICPGTGLRQAHRATVYDVTIDHIEPVAAHWGREGCNSNRLTRVNWYQDTNNHAYLCRACNSSRGSGGIRYVIAVGHGYSN